MENIASNERQLKKKEKINLLEVVLEKKAVTIWKKIKRAKKLEAPGDELPNAHPRQWHDVTTLKEKRINLRNIDALRGEPKVLLAMVCLDNQIGLAADPATIILLPIILVHLGPNEVQLDLLVRSERLLWNNDSRTDDEEAEERAPII
jgi:hypothetical protein